MKEIEINLIKYVCFNTLWTKIQMEVFVWIRNQTIKQ